MNRLFFQGLIFILALLPVVLYSQSSFEEDQSVRVAIIWEKGIHEGTLSTKNGNLSDIHLIRGEGEVAGEEFRIISSGESRLEITLQDVHIEPGPGPTLVSVITRKNPFTFFLRDIKSGFPVFIPDYRVAIVPANDKRTFREIREDLSSRDLKTNLEKIQAEPETSFNQAKFHTRDQVCPTLLGLGRDMRIFEFSPALNDRPQENDLISPRNASQPVKLPGTNDRPLNYIYTAGRGQSVNMKVKRHLEGGSLPILHLILNDDDIEYHSVLFVSLEKSRLTRESVGGTHYLVADYNSAGNMITDRLEPLLNRELEKDKDQSDETVLFFRSIARNTGNIPRYAWFKFPRPGRGWWEKIPYTYDPGTGFSKFSKDEVFAVSTLNGKPVPNEEIAVLIQPGDSAVFTFCIPHSPVSNQRAVDLSTRDFDGIYKDCREFWLKKLDRGTQMRLPEKRIEEMMNAGLLHLDLITYGREPDGTLAPTIGIYSPIGTESSPGIQFYNSMGWDDVAKRSLMYFLDKQHPDGMIQNFGGYMVETGAALWSMGEYYRYTLDSDWVKKVKPELLKSCDFLIKWRNRNKIDSLRYDPAGGYGMIDGKVADPEDPFHQYMLNGYGYLGLKRVAEMLSEIDPERSEDLGKEAEAWREDIRSSLFMDMARSPVVPLGDGTWVPTVPPWTEATGPRSLFIEPGTFFSHGTFTVADAMLGPLYLTFCEVLEPGELASEFILGYTSELFLEENAAFSQPYYSRHNWLQLKLGMVKPFLRTYYTTMAALADRETYTFWEHLYHVSVHKTHEEGWFLMQTRWMLYMENGNTLNLLPAVPRSWLGNGKEIDIKNAGSYFGNFDLQVRSRLSDGYIEAEISCDPSRKPDRVTIRIPHPHNMQPKRISGGIYRKETETVTIDPFFGDAKIRIEY